MVYVDEEESRVIVLNTPILTRSAGLSRNLFPKTYKVKNNWMAWALAVCGLLVVLSPNVIVPLIVGHSIFPLKVIWHGWYVLWIAFYTCLVLSILLCKIPYAIEREADRFTIHFLLRKVQVPLADIEEVRVVRKWMVKDSVKMAAKAAPGISCIGAQNNYEEVGAPKQHVRPCFPFSLCEPFLCFDSDTKFFWGAPGAWSREVCIVSVKNTSFNNYVFDLGDMDSFIQDNRPGDICCCFRGASLGPRERIQR